MVRSNYDDSYVIHYLFISISIMLYGTKILFRITPSLIQQNIIYYLKKDKTMRYYRNKFESYRSCPEFN